MTARISVHHVPERIIIAKAFDAVCKIQDGVVLMQCRAELIPVKLKTTTLLLLYCLVFSVIPCLPPSGLAT